MIPDSCPLKPRLQAVPGRCARVACDRELPKGRRRWCSDECGGLPEFWDNHFFASARHAALQRDGFRCVRCGANGDAPKDERAAIIAPAPYEYRKGLRYWERDDFKVWHGLNLAYNAALDALDRKYRLEVNHKVPALGAHAEVSCIHHLDNLETLCGPCHRGTTSAQARERADSRRGRTPLFPLDVRMPARSAASGLQGRDVLSSSEQP
jgi:5-methylcytosine-specific restriction endonuclease McrA